MAMAANNFASDYYLTTRPAEQINMHPKCVVV